jgi:oxalate decarboxylase
MKEATVADLSRRNVIGVAAAAGSIVAATSASSALAAGEQPRFGPSPAPLSGKELPSFRFPLGAQPAKDYDGGWAKEATVAEFPVSEKLAGVLMQLSPGALRELHWHANAAEWAYVLKGRCRVTTIDPQAHSEVVDFAAGDVWYFPRGHGHSIQGLGPDDCQFILVFDNGYFSEFGTFSITDWLGHTPAEVLAKNFGTPAAAFAAFPKREVYMAKGPLPPPLPPDPAPGSLNVGAATHRYRLLAQRAETFPGGSLRLVSVFGSHGRARTEEFAAGDVGYVPQGYGHYIENTGSEELEVVVVLNNGSYESISVTAWIAANPDLLLATNFKVPERTFAGFPKRETIMPE